MKNYLSPAPEIVVAPTQTFPLGPGPYSPPGNYPYGIACGDLDDDGRDEIVLFNSAVPTLGLLSYFEYADLSPTWASQTQGQIVNLWSCTNQVPNGWTLHGNDMYLTADVDGDGSDEIITIYSVDGFNPPGQSIGVSKFQNASLSTLWTGLPLVGTLDLYEYYVADVDGDGCEEIVCLSPLDTNICVLKWDKVSSTLGMFLQPTYTSITRSDQVFIAKLSGSNGDPRDHLVVYSPTSLTLQAWLWNPVSKQLMGFGPASQTIPAPAPAQGTTPAGWKMSANDQFTVADINGQGSDALVVYNATSQQFGVVEWDIPNSVFNAPWTGAAASVVPGNFQSSATYLFPAKVSGQAGEQILVYNQSGGAPGQTFMGVLKWGGSALTGSVVAAQAALPGYVTDAAWIAPQDVDGDGNTELVFVNSGTQTIGLLKWDGTTLSSQWSAQNSVQGYSVDLIMGAPKTPLTPFADNQLLIYQYISNQLDPNVNGDIRGEYGNAEYALAGGFGEFALQLLKMTPWLPAGATETDWDAVKTPLYNELYAVDSVTAWQQDWHHLNGALQKAAVTAMGNAWTDVDLTGQSTNTDTLTYKISEILNAVFDAAIWGLAGFSLEAEEVEEVAEEAEAEKEVNVWNSIQVGLAVGASLYGSYTSAIGPGGDDVPLAIDYAASVSAINDQYADVDSQIDTNIDRILADEVLLPLFGKLASMEYDQAWRWSDSDMDNIAKSAITPGQVYYYTVFIPLRFGIYAYWGSNTATPYYCLEEGNSQSGYYYTRVNLNPPSYAVWSQDSGNGTWDISVLAAGANPATCSYPAQQLFTNIANCGVPLPALFQRWGVWSAIPVTGGTDTRC